MAQPSCIVVVVVILLVFVTVYCLCKKGCPVKLTPQKISVEQADKMNKDSLVSLQDLQRASNLSSLNGKFWIKGPVATKHCCSLLANISGGKVFIVGPKNTESYYALLLDCS